MTQTLFSHASTDIEKASRIYVELQRTPPTTKRYLKNYVKVFLGIDVPDKRICPDHSSPMDYLWHSFSADAVSIVNSRCGRPANADAALGCAPKALVTAPATETGWRGDVMISGSGRERRKRARKIGCSLGPDG